MQFLNTRYGKILISIIWALVIAGLFMKVCAGGQCLVFDKRPIPMPKKVIGEASYDFDYPRSCGRKDLFYLPDKRHRLRHQPMNPQCTPDAATPLSCYHHHPMDSIYQAPNRGLDNYDTRN